jgi:putative transposase
MADNGVECSMSRSGNVWDNAAMGSFFPSLKTELIGRKLYRTRDAAPADVFDYIQRFYNTIRRRSTIGYVSPVEFERKVGLSLTACPRNPQQVTKPTAGRRESQAFGQAPQASRTRVVPRTKTDAT